MCVQRRCVHCGLLYEVLLCLNMVSLSMKCDVDCCSASSAIVLCFTGSAIAHSQTQLQCASYLAVHAAMTLRYVNFSKTDFSVTEFRTEKYILIYFFTFVKVLPCFETRNFGGTCCVRPEKRGQRVHPERWYSNHLNKLRRISEHTKLSVFPICIFFVFFHFSPSGVGFRFFFVLNRNLICGFLIGMCFCTLK